MLEFIAYLALGRLIVWFIGYAKPTQWLWFMFDSCDLCLGVWVFFLLALFAPDLVAAPLDIIGPRVPALGEFILGMIASFVVHIFRLGWEIRFGAVQG